LIEARLAGLPSPVDAAVPLPATVVMTFAATWRMRLLVVSAMSRLVLEVTAIPLGPFRLASVAEPPSPANPAAPLPATVVIVAPASTRRMRLPPVSAMK
jgi:hypothetical protein